MDDEQFQHLVVDRLARIETTQDFIAEKLVTYDKLMGTRMRIVEQAIFGGDSRPGLREEVAALTPAMTKKAVAASGGVSGMITLVIIFVAQRLGIQLPS